MKWHPVFAAITLCWIATLTYLTSELASAVRSQRTQVESVLEKHAKDIARHDLAIEGMLLAANTITKPVAPLLPLRNHVWDATVYDWYPAPKGTKFRPRKFQETCAIRGLDEKGERACVERTEQ